MANVPPKIAPPPAGIGSGIVGAAKGTEHFFEALVNPHTWVRVGEVLFGTILLIVGFDHMFNTNMAGKIAKLGPVA